MRFKKQIGIIVSCVLILGVVFFAVSYIGDKDESASKDNDVNSALSNDVTDGEKDTANDLTEDENNLANGKSEEAETAKGSNHEIAEGIKEGYYTVKEGDTLYSIAKTYMPKSESAIVVEAIKSRNKLQDDTISNGQKLVISYETALENKSGTSQENATNDGEHTNHKSYVIKEGDTLFTIAKDYMTNVNVIDGIESIKAHNNMGESDVIKVDQTICIPPTQQ